LSARSSGLRALAFAACAWISACPPAGAQTAAPHPAATVSPPKVPLHAEVFVDTNKLGQVTHVVSIKPSTDRGFNTQAYGNAAQTYIRTPNGDAVAGVYRLSYDYDPKTQKVRREVQLVKTGGVDPNAPGIITVMKAHLAEEQKRQAAAQAPTKLPDFDKITAPTPSH
jgi:hypothetical protein